MHSKYTISFKWTFRISLFPKFLEVVLLPEAHLSIPNYKTKFVHKINFGMLVYNKQYL